jgi:DNA-binding CsgD family transcriptional regulator
MSEEARVVAGLARRLVPSPAFVVTSDCPLAGTVLPVESDQCVLGRRRDCDLHLPDPHVSRVHALVRRRGGAVWIEDFGSTGGTSVNGEPVTGSHVLRHGDVVRFGPIEARFEDHGSAAGDEAETQVFGLSPSAQKPVLSRRQHEVLDCMRDGLTNPEIAARLGVTQRTVKSHCREIFDRLGVPNRTAAVAAATRLGLLDCPDDSNAQEKVR